MAGNFIKVCLENKNSVKIEQNYRALYVHEDLHFLIANGELLSVTSPLCSMNKFIDIVISQNTTQFYVKYISQIHVSAHFRPSSGCSFSLANVVA